MTGSQVATLGGAMMVLVVRVGSHTLVAKGIKVPRTNNEPVRVVIGAAYVT
jgi:hypothetical protein